LKITIHLIIALTILSTNNLFSQSKKPNQELSLKIFSMTGKLMLSKIASTNENINITELLEGVYFYKIIGKENLFWSGKLIITN